MSYQLAARDVESMAPESGAAATSPGADPFSTIMGRSPAILEAVEVARRIARRGASNVLLFGETGTGKEVFARAIHYAGPRPSAPFVAINCAAIPPALLESELFGYEKGAFTDAKHTKEGLLELARDGTLFLDEVSSLPIDLQPKLLRVLEERRVRRVGGFTEIDVRCRVIAATNHALEALVQEGLFREDLFYRLNVLRVSIPPLRERAGDVVLLAERFLLDGAAAQGLPAVKLTAPAADVLGRHKWPGNVRELKNVMERALLMSDGRAIEARHLLLDHREPRGIVPDAAIAGGLIAIPPDGRSLRSVEAELLKITLGLTSWNKSAAARILGISRPTLHKKLDEYNILAPAQETT